MTENVTKGRKTGGDKELMGGKGETRRHVTGCLFTWLFFL